MSSRVPLPCATIHDQTRRAFIQITYNAERCLYFDEPAGRCPEEFLLFAEVNLHVVLRLLAPAWPDPVECRRPLPPRLGVSNVAVGLGGADSFVADHDMTPSHHVRTSALSAASPSRSVRPEKPKSGSAAPRFAWKELGVNINAAGPSSGSSAIGTFSLPSPTPQRHRSASSSSCGSRDPGRRGRRWHPHGKDQERSGTCSSVDFHSLSRVQSSRTALDGLSGSSN